MESKKGFSILKIFVIIVCIILIALSLVVNILFSRKNTPEIFGYYVYVLNNDDMGELLPQGTALISKNATGLTVNQGDVILCRLSETDELSIRTVYKIGIDEATGIENYYLATSEAQISGDNSVNEFVTKEKIIAVCTGYPQNINLGRYITFTSGIKGILLQLILPSIVLVIFLIVKIASSRDEEDDDEDYGFYDYDEAVENRPKETASPLFEATQDSYASDELERKKQSIAENFSQKEVNPNSPYQKEKERTMQFKAFKEATGKFPAQNGNTTANANQVDVTEMFTAPKGLSNTMQFTAQRSAESSFAARNISSQSSTAPTADALREEMLRRTAEAELNTVKEVYANNPERTVQPNIPTHELPKTAPLRSPTAQQAQPRKSNTPNIDDILQKSDSETKKKNISTMSVDDLLSMIESEKNK